MKAKRRIFKVILFLVMVCFLQAGMVAKKNKDKPIYRFKVEKKIKATPVKNQGSTGTCWAFATISFLESEIIKKGRGEFDLSEMFIARHAYTDKARQYVYMHGRANFGPGGQSHDVIDQMKKNGIVPESIYPGLLPSKKRHNHREIGAVLQGMLNGVLKSRDLSSVWQGAFKAVLDVYFGKSPESFSYKGKEYTPHSFLKEGLGLNLEDYIEITSYTHHPFYKKCRLELPDNWSYDNNYYNIPIDDMVNEVYQAIKNGYTFCWDADVSEKFFSKGVKDVSLVPEKDWAEWSKKEKDKKITKPLKEKKITQEMRQETFENWTTTDDHLMHIIGVAKDQTGKKFFILKNSWGKDRKYQGYFYVSKSYFRLKTICIMINKNALSPQMKTKLNIK